MIKGFAHPSKSTTCDEDAYEKIHILSHIVRVKLEKEMSILVLSPEGFRQIVLFR